MVEPGTAAIAVLSTIAGVSGYGAMKMNAKQRDLIEEEISKRVATIEQAKQAAEVEIARLRAELERLRQTPPPPAADAIPPPPPAAEQQVPPPPPPAAEQQVPPPPPPAAEQQVPPPPPPAAEQQVPPPPPPPAAEQSPETEATRPVDEQERARCREVLEGHGIRTLRDWRTWSLRNRDSPDLAIVNNCADILLKNRTGGNPRKNKLRTRRKTIQNGRRTRGGKNSANRTHSHAR